MKVRFKDKIKDTLTSEEYLDLYLGYISILSGLDRGEILKKNRKRYRVYARHALFYILRESHDVSTVDIERLTGFDHSTVVHATKNISRLIHQDPIVRGWIESLESLKDDREDCLRARVKSIIREPDSVERRTKKMIILIEEYEKGNIPRYSEVQVEEDTDEEGSGSASEEVAPRVCDNSDSREDRGGLYEKQILNG